LSIRQLPMIGASDRTRCG